MGDLRLPFPIPERAADIQGLILGFSGMGGTYDLEGQLKYQLWDVNWAFAYEGVSLSGEAMYSSNQFLSPLVQSSGAALISPITQTRRSEEIYGYFVQGAFPLMRRPPFGQRLTGAARHRNANRATPS